LVIEPRCVFCPLDDSLGTNPTNAMNCPADAKRRRSPISAAITTELIVATPRSD